jgi:hypothetical protein
MSPWAIEAVEPVSCACACPRQISALNTRCKPAAVAGHIEMDCVDRRSPFTDIHPVDHGVVCRNAA